MIQTRQVKNRNRFSLPSGSHFLSGYTSKATKPKKTNSPKGFNTMAHIQPSMD